MIGGLLDRLIGPVFGVIDKMVVDKDEANRIKLALHTQMLTNEAEMTRAMSSIITSEAQGKSWLQRNWRPLMMVWFGFLLGMYWFGYAPEYLTESPELTNSLFDLLKIGIGGYIGSRGVEKIAPVIASAIGGNNSNQ